MIRKVWDMYSMKTDIKWVVFAQFTVQLEPNVEELVEMITIYAAALDVAIYMFIYLIACFL